VCIPQILRVIPYSATQLYSYEVLKRAFSDRDGKLSVPARLSAGACAGMTATLVRCALAGESCSFSRPALQHDPSQTRHIAPPQHHAADTVRVLGLHVLRTGVQTHVT